MKRSIALTLAIALTACGTTTPRSVAQGPASQLSTLALGSITVQPSSASRTQADANATDGQRAALLGNGETATFTLPSTLTPGRYTVKVRAFGDYYQTWPTVAFKQGTTSLATATIDSATYVERPLGDFDLKPGDIRTIEFTNDLYGGTASTDRNVYVDALTLTPATPAPVEPSSTINNAAFTSDGAASQGQAVYLQNNDQGARFTVPSTGHYTLKVVARGTAYYGWPLLAIRSGSSTLNHVMVDTSTYAPRTAGVFDLTAGQTIDVIFANDAYGGSASTDRNAIVDHLLLEPAVPGGTSVTSFPVNGTPANGSDSTDDAAALNQAAASGQNLYFPPGTYILNSPLVLSGKSNITVEGNGAILKAGPGFNDPRGVLVLANTSNVTIKDLTVVGRTDLSQASDAVLVTCDVCTTTSGTGNVLTNLSIQGAETMGVRLVRATYTTVSGSTISGMGMHGIWATQANNTTLVNNTITGMGPSSTLSPGIGILGTKGNTILIEGNRIKQINNTATKTEGYDNATFRNNLVDAFSKDGIKIMDYNDGGITQVGNGVIEGNTISGFTGLNSEASSNIAFQGVIGGRASGNVVYGNPNSATQGTNAQGQPVTVEQDGIRVNEGLGGVFSKNIVVENNLVYAFKNKGLHTHSPGIIARNNTFSSDIGSPADGSWAIYLGKESVNAQITGNVLKATATGVHFENFPTGSASGATVDSNTFNIGTTTSGTGVYAANANNNNNTITNNNFNDTRTPITLSGTGNICRGNQGTYIKDKVNGC